jgi:hypothetical protein
MGATAVMDWGRGAWPSQVMWRWASGSGTVGGQPFAFNFGNGFGDPAAATENFIQVGDVPYKLGAVEWTYSADDPMQPWTFRSDDGAVNLGREPIAPDTGGLDLGSKYEHVHKAYGTYSGTVTLAGGKTLSIDGILGAAEQVDISW